MAPKRYTAEQIIGHADKIHIQDDPKRGPGYDRDDMDCGVWSSGIRALILHCHSVALHTTVDALKIRKTPLTAALVMPDVLRKSSSRKSAFPASRAGRRWLGQKSANE